MTLELCLFALALLPQSSSDNEFAWGDFNSDGLLDLVVAVDGVPKLFQNSGDGAFEERSKELGLDSIEDAHLDSGKTLMETVILSSSSAAATVSRSFKTSEGERSQM